MTVTLLPRESAMYVESALLQGLSLSPFRIAAAGESELSVDFSIGDIRVEYSNIRRDGFLGSRLVDRRVSLLLSAKAFERKSGAVRIAKDYAEQATDTIPLSAVPGIESPLLPLTRGSVPSEGFFTNVAEPLVMLGAIAVAVYLLYSVRN
jgi:hypothetical protein